MQKKNDNKRLSFEQAIIILYDKNIISDDFSKLLHEWREERNNFVHNLINQDIEEESLKDIVYDGKNILDKIKEELNE